MISFVPPQKFLREFSDQFGRVIIENEVTHRSLVGIMCVYVEVVVIRILHQMYAQR